ncbi:serine/threonine-protein kinase [Geodermatophilus sp. CPCC 205761]|uniref:serine/threonine-protein kinase n=1 Tax=Geodermatophilus sp. CPCC 205761 TaxID=2936597 RepID=UPI003EED4F27
MPGYRLEELLGRGGSGEVWRGVPRSGGPPVAVKVLVAGDPERQAREAALLGELDHPHLVRLVDVVHQPRRGAQPRVALVLDLLPGGSLAALLARRGRLRPGEVVTAVAPVAAALAHAHEHGVVHGDLSPGNIVFTAEGRPVLTDLGVARVLGEAAAGEVTPAYVDPTVARGGAPGPASDVFGVAAAAFHALTGVAPWNAATAADTLRVAADGVIPDLAELAPDAPAELRDVIGRGLSADPHLRGSAAAFALDLRHACRPEPVRLPVARVLEEDLAGTGGPRTELTHQVPGRHRRTAEPPEPPRRRIRLPAGTAETAARRIGVVVAVGVVLAGVVWLGGRWAQPDAPPARAAELADRAASSPRTTAPLPDTPPAEESPQGEAAQDDSAEAWRDRLTTLYGRRAAAFRTGSVDLLDEVHLPGTPMATADRETVSSLLAAGESLRGFTPAVLRVTVVDGGVAQGRVTLQVVDTWPAYDVVAVGAPDGPARRSVDARGEDEVRMTLVAVDGDWRIDSAERIR